MRASPAALVLLLCFAVRPACGADVPGGAPAAGDAAAVADRLSRIERIMWERDVRAVPELREHAAGDPDEKVRERAIGALTLLEDKGAGAIFLLRLSSDPSARVRRAAADAIGVLSIPPDRPSRLTDPLRKDPDPLVRAECARAIGKLGIQAAAGNLMYSVAADPSAQVRSRAAEALSRLHAAEAAAVLSAAAASDRSTMVRVQAVRALAEVTPGSSSPLFRSLWKESVEPELRLEAFLGLLRTAEGARTIEEGLADADVSVRLSALRAWTSRLAASPPDTRFSRTSPVVARLESLLKDPERGIREHSRRALENLGFKIRPDGFAYAIDDR